MELTGRKDLQAKALERFNAKDSNASLVERIASDATVPGTRNKAAAI